MKRIKINLIFKILQCSLENFGESLRVGDGEFCPPEIENTFFFFHQSCSLLSRGHGMGEAFVWRPGAWLSVLPSRARASSQARWVGEVCPSAVLSGRQVGWGAPSCFQFCYPCVDLGFQEKEMENLFQSPELFCKSTPDTTSYFQVSNLEG